MMLLLILCADVPQYQQRLHQLQHLQAVQGFKDEHLVLMFLA